MAYLNITRSIDLGLRDRIAMLLKLSGEAAQKRAMYRQTVRELSVLSDRELSDLGIHRSMIKQIAIDAANRV